MSEYKSGDLVRIVRTDYDEEGLDVGTVHSVKSVDIGGVHLSGSVSGELYFYNREVEPYTEYTTTYTRILEAIAGPENTQLAKDILEALNAQ